MQQTLARQIAQFQTDSYLVPGLILLTAKLDLLNGKPAQARSKLGKLPHLASPVEWLTHGDPIFYRLEEVQ